MAKTLKDNLHCQIHDDKNIKGFFGDYRFLSNFHLAEVVYEDIVYNCNENVYQAAKCVNLEDAEKFQFISPSEAKKLGQKVKMRND